MSTRASRGLGAALIVIGSAAAASAADAQSVGVTRVRGDSVFVRQLLPGSLRIDSVMMLFGALQREPFGSAEWVALRSKIDSLLPTLARVRVSAPSDAVPRGWIGINVGGVPRHEMITDAGDVIRYLAYPAVISVDPESPASRAGIAPGDLLVAYNGVDVVDHDVNLTRLFVPEKRMSVTVRRDGEMKDFAVQIAKMPEHVFQRRLDFDAVGDGRDRRVELRAERGDGERTGISRIAVLPPMPGGGPLTPMRGYVFAPDGIFGARVSPVSPELARALKLAPGILVNDVADESLAARCGLRTGDVIVSASGRSVTSMNELQRAIVPHLSDRMVDLQIVRERKTRKITVKW